MDKILYRRAYPLFGDYLSRNSLQQYMYVLLELPDGTWVADLGSDYVGPTSLYDLWLDVMDDLEARCPILGRIVRDASRLPEIEEDDAVDMLWHGTDGKIMCVYRFDKDTYIAVGEEFGSRDEAVAYAVTHHLPLEIVAAEESLARQYPQVSAALTTLRHV